MAKTEAGLQVLRDRRSGLSPRQRAALILIDGQRGMDELLAATGITRADIDRLLQLGLVTEHVDSRPAPLRTLTGEPAFLDSTSVDWERYVRAYGIATELTGRVRHKDDGLALAVEAAGTLEELDALAPRILAAVGPARFARLEAALKLR